MTPPHEFEKADDLVITYTLFHCNDIGKSCKIKYGGGFDYCPFCGEQLPESEL